MMTFGLLDFVIYYGYKNMFELKYTTPFSWTEKVMADFSRDYWMDAEESLEYGIVDKILS